MKPSEWLKKNLDGHAILSHDGAARDFRKETGREPCWPTHTFAETLAADRGLGVTITGAEEPVAWGYEVATYIALTYLPGGFHTCKAGRGSIFRHAVIALEKAGL